MGVEVVAEGLSKSFGKQRIWHDVSLALPPGEVSVLLGPSGTGKSVFLKCLVGLLKPEYGRVLVNGVDVVSCHERELYEVRRMFGVLFQDGALFGSMNLYDNVAFPLREHTRKSESDIRRIVLDKMDMVGLTGDGANLPGEISGGMRKRARLARALVLDPQVILCDEPDSGLDPVRTAYLSQLLVDLNAQTDAAILIVTHNINVARTVPDNIGMLFRRELVMFGPREVLLTSDEPVVEQFVNGRRQGPIGMSEEKDHATLAAEAAQERPPRHEEHLPEQLRPSPGLPQRSAVRRRRDRVMSMLPALPPRPARPSSTTWTPRTAPATAWAWHERRHGHQERGQGDRRPAWNRLASQLLPRHQEVSSSTRKVNASVTSPQAVSRFLAYERQHRATPLYANDKGDSPVSPEVSVSPDSPVRFV